MLKELSSRALDDLTKFVSLRVCRTILNLAFTQILHQANDKPPAKILSSLIVIAVGGRMNIGTHVKDTGQETKTNPQPQQNDGVGQVTIRHQSLL